MAFTILLKTKDAFEDVKPVNLTGVISLMKETFCWFHTGYQFFIEGTNQ